MRYTTDATFVHFEPRAVQDQPGNVIYDLSPLSDGVHWVASGTIGGCPAEGEATVLFPGVPYTGIEPAAGYLVVVGPGDNHSSMITAAPEGATVTVTCPAEPEPIITETAFAAGLLLQVLGWPNSDNGTRYFGDCQLNFGDLSYYFSWNLSRTGPSQAQEPPVGPSGTTPECFDATPCPPICARATGLVRKLP